MFLRIFLVSTAVFLFGTSAFSQITVTNTQTPIQLVENVLLGFGVTASNITVNGTPLNSTNIQGNVSYFDASGTAFPIPTGVLLTTGNGIAAIGPNSSGSFTNNAPATPSVATDPHLISIANAAPTNGVVLEFDFVPSGDTISFNYIFGSDEYPEFSPSTFNDAFGFFLWGPGITGPYALGGYPAGGSNLAIIPGTTTPVTINNLGPGAGQFPQFYTNNLGGAAYGTAIQYDGTTVTLSANATVQCNQIYHIKLAISNVGDQSYDSGVFLQANSFSSEAVEVAVATVSGDTSVIEGCTTADLMFIRPQSQIGDTLIVNYTIGGTATQGTDYPGLPNPVIFLPGEDSVILTIDPLADGIPDNLEYVTITATTITICGDTIVSTGTLWIIDTVNIEITEPDPTVLCANDSVLIVVTANGGAEPYTYTWNDVNSQTGDSVYLSSPIGVLTGATDYIVTVTDACGYSNTDTVTITLNQMLSVDTTVSYPSAACDATGAVSASTSGETGIPLYQWIGPGANSSNSIDATVWENISPGWYYFTVTDDVCTANDSVFVDVEPPPVASFTANPQSGCSPLVVTFTNTSQNAVNYEWNFGGTVVTTASSAMQNQTFTNSAVIQLVAFDAGGCSDTTFSTVTVTTCGCTDPEAENYNPGAVIDDGSCYYPQPIIYVPNVFTPNGDNQNDFFFIGVENAIDLEFTIVNRWGNVVYFAEGLTSKWNGYIEGGNFAQDGTYFIKYTVTAIDGTLTEGHGFVQLVAGKKP
jgi:gliding motility-associated-like protein